MAKAAYESLRESGWLLLQTWEQLPSNQKEKVVAAIRAALAVQPSPGPALLRAALERIAALAYNPAQDRDAQMAGIARDALAADTPASPGPSIADLKPGAYRLYIHSNGDGEVYGAANHLSMRVKSWPAGRK